MTLKGVGLLFAKKKMQVQESFFGLWGQEGDCRVAKQFSSAKASDPYFPEMCKNPALSPGDSDLQAKSWKIGQLSS